MKLINHQYTSNCELREFINKNSILDMKNIFLQIFTSINKKSFIISLIDEIKTIIPNIAIIGATTSGEISNNGVKEHTTLLSFSIFDNTKIKTYFQEANNDSFKTGKNLISKIDNHNIKIAICFSDGLHTNGEELLNGISSINNNIIIAGGMASDYSRFENTYVFTENHITNQGAVLATLDNNDLIVHTKYNFNWDTLGIKHKVTKSYKNRVYKIGDKTAVEFYKYYFGERIETLLPAIGIEFPLIIEKNGLKIARAAIEKHDDGSLSFAGNIKEESSIQFGYGNINKILEKSLKTTNTLKNKPIEATYIYSCMARHTLLKENSNFEIDPLKRLSNVCGFFTNGEFYRDCKGDDCKNYLLNETMTTISISEQDKNSNRFNVEDKLNLSNYELLDFHRIEALSEFISRTTNELENLNQNLQKKVEEETKKNKQKEEQLQIANTQAQLGSMLEMILHQWRQPLNGILTATSAIQIKTELDLLNKDELLKITKTIMNLTNHANDTIEDFRSIFNKEQEKKYITPKDIIKKANQVLKSLLNKNCIYIREIYKCEGEGKLFIHIGQLLQVIIIIVKNAVDAIVENDIVEGNIEIEVSKNKEYCLFKIKDNGGGIPENIIHKIFQKRFSTKLKTHGTGIGLDICKTIIEKNIKGKIEVYNENQGAVFNIYIPHNLNE